MSDNLNVFIRSILAGICIGLGGAIFVKLGGFIGAFMFAFGLLSVVHFKLPLYTGTAGFIELNKWQEYKKMVIILLGNILGCFILAQLLDHSQYIGDSIIQSRINSGYVRCLLNGIWCGFTMTLIVQGGRDKNWLLILFGIPLFILLGFYHSIADAFYASISSIETNKQYVLYYIIIVLGNFIGCNIPRLLKYKNDKKVN